MEYKQIEHARDLTVEELAAELVAARAALKQQEEVIWYLERAVAEATPEATPDAYSPSVQADLKRKRDSAFWASDYGQALGRIVVDSYDANRRAE
jgi:hypothetical protein